MISTMILVITLSRLNIIFDKEMASKNQAWCYSLIVCHLPLQRKLPAELEKEACQLMVMGGNKEIIQQELSSRSRKVITICNSSGVFFHAKTCKEGKDLSLKIRFHRNLREEFQIQFRKTSENWVVISRC